MLILAGTIAAVAVFIADVVVVANPLTTCSREGRFGLPSSPSVGSGGKVPMANDGSSGSCSRYNRESSRAVRTPIVTDFVGSLAVSRVKSV